VLATARSMRSRLSAAAPLGVQAPDRVEDLARHGHVERAHRFVEHHEARAGDERARDGHALALAAGELAGVTLRQGGIEPHVGEHRVQSRASRGPVHALHDQRLDAR